MLELGYGALLKALVLDARIDVRLGRRVTSVVRPLAGRTQGAHETGSACSCWGRRTHSPTNSLTHPLTHPLTHSLTHSEMHVAADKVVLHFAAAPEETCDMVVLSGPITHFVRSAWF